MYMANTRSWYLERVIWLVAGVMILASLTLALAHSIWWLILTALVGVNLIIFALTGFCLMANILVFLGAKPLPCSGGDLPERNDTGETAA